jgi:hypothetical protein
MPDVNPTGQRAKDIGLAPTMAAAAGARRPMKARSAARSGPNRQTPTWDGNVVGAPGFEPGAS